MNEFSVISIWLFSFFKTDIVAVVMKFLFLLVVLHVCGYLLQPCVVDDIADFKRHMGLYPLPKPFIDIGKAKSKL